jgi:Holliday junction resolvase RusA-like endonuclease
MPVKFEVLGVPVGKGRPKFSTVNGHAVAYTPAKTANYETLVKLSYQQKYSGCIFEKNVPLMADITALFPIPKSASKKLQAKMLSGAVRPTKKPDCDNIIKAVLDALNGVAYYDDSQVVKICIRKRYDTNPRTIIEIIELKEG